MVEGRSFTLLKQRYHEDSQHPDQPIIWGKFSLIRPPFRPILPSLIRAGPSSTSTPVLTRVTTSLTRVILAAVVAYIWGFFRSVVVAVLRTKSGKGRSIPSLLTCVLRCVGSRFIVLRSIPAFIKSGFWPFDQQNQEYKNTLLSDGKRPPNGLMPNHDRLYLRQRSESEFW